MAISRRAVLIGLTGLGISPQAALSTIDGHPAFIACCRLSDGSFAVAVITPEGQILRTEILAGRGHDVAISPDRSVVVVFARRPGRFALVLDPAGREPPAAFAPPPDRHFYGHGFFSTDGALLYATENDFDAERGVLGVYDVKSGFQRQAELDCHGIGPHQAILMKDGRTVCVANGGIATHPDYPRQKLNLPSMAPALVYLDRETGALLERVTLDDTLRQLSLRHLAEAGNEIWIGGQYEGARGDQVPLIATHRLGHPLEPVEAPADLYASMNHYVGSISASVDGSRVAATSPRGGKAVIWNRTRRSILKVSDLADVGGVARDQSGFALSGGDRIVRANGAAHGFPGLLWDNHMRAL
ncbi:MAG: DUF1513 domain-containing protein [Pseudomonadota bacterium]